MHIKKALLNVGEGVGRGVGVCRANSASWAYCGPDYGTKSYITLFPFTYQNVSLK